MQIGDFKVTKLDRRYNGHQNFAYMAEPHVARLTMPFPRNMKTLMFCHLREWCWSQWGPSCELHLHRLNGSKDVDWCWESEYNKLRIYIRSDEQLALFTLAFSG